MSGATNNQVASEINRIPDVLRQSVALWAERLDQEKPGSIDQLSDLDDDLRTLIRLVASSEFASNALIREWDWFRSALELGALVEPPNQKLIRKFADAAGSAEVDVQRTNGGCP